MFFPIYAGLITLATIKLPKPNHKDMASYTKALLREIKSRAQLATWYFTDLTKKNPTEQIPNSGQPILCIHGLFHNSSGWKKYQVWLEKKQVGPVFTVNLPSTLDPIEKNAEYVSEKVQEIVRLTGRKDIIIVGHSMGGLVGSWAATENGQDAVKGVITLGSPLQGTKMARLILAGKSIAQMRCGSSFIQSLEKRVKNNSRLFFYHFGSTADTTIIPQKSAIFGGQKNRYAIFPNMGHTSYLLSRETFDAVHTVIHEMQEEKP